MLIVLVALALATLASEDLACAAAGGLIARGDVPAAAGITACAAGILVGDCGLWAIGFAARRTSARWRRLDEILASGIAERWRGWLERHGGLVIVLSRFAPGSRLPLYLSAGWSQFSLRRFAAWSAFASALWTPAVVLASARVSLSARPAVPSGLWSTVLGIVLTLVIARTLRSLSPVDTWRSVRRVAARARRWEFWPAWLFYAPVACWVVLLALRYRSLGVLIASNPGIADGGIVGESKADILAALPAEWTVPFVRLEHDDRSDSTAAARAHMAHMCWTFPVVMKPDVGQRGAGVRLIHSDKEMAAYLARSRGAVLLQPFHEGPYEAGIFYYRFPGQPRGTVLSITDKRFPVIVGDGRATVRTLIERHPRYALQAPLFLRRHAAVADTVLAMGEPLRLAIAGNHARGTMFLDGEHLRTPQLEARVDAIARACPGFYIGRFDVRYRDVDAFTDGRDLAIVELNGATSESTNIYDPATRLIDAYRVLFKQWSLVFAIGAANRARVITPASSRRVLSLIVAHLSAPTVVDALAD